jgi:sugar phosphate isomerase/epimerase
MKLSLGINNCFAVKRWPRPDEWAQIVSDELDLHWVQHSLDLSDLRHAPEAEAEVVRTACERAGVRIGSVFTGLIAYSANLMLAPTRPERERAVADWSQAIRFAAQLGVPAVGGHVGSLSRPDADDNERGRIRAGRVLEALAASGASEAALVLEVIPPFEARDEQVLEDLRASVDYWQRALVRFNPMPSD